MILMASKGHFLTQMPQPMHNSSEMLAILELGVTSIHNLPIRTTGQDFLHSCRHRLGLHRSLFTMAIRVKVSPSSASFLLLLGGILAVLPTNAITGGISWMMGSSQGLLALSMEWMSLSLPPGLKHSQMFSWTLHHVLVGWLIVRKQRWLNPTIWVRVSG